MEFRIRRAKPQDYEALCRLFEPLDEIHRDRLPHIFRKPTGPPRAREYIEGLLEDPQVCFLLVEVGGQPVGFVNGLLRDTPPIELLVPTRLAIVDAIFVDPQFRGMGLGRGLMKELEIWAARAGAEYLELNVYEFNASAVRFYERLGYNALSRRMRKGLHGISQAFQP